MAVTDRLRLIAFQDLVSV